MSSIHNLLNVGVSIGVAAVEACNGGAGHHLDATVINDCNNIDFFAAPFNLMKFVDDEVRNAAFVRNSLGRGDCWGCKNYQRCCQYAGRDTRSGHV
jgi:hypothetical protein